MALVKYDLMFDDEANKFVAVNPITCEVKDVCSCCSTKKTTTRSTKKKVEDTDPVAKLTLEDSKYILNAAAIKLMGVEPDDKIAVKYESVNKVQRPIIGTNEVFGTKTGNRLTKSFTVSCRGQQHDRLAEFGDMFVIESHPTKEGLFLLSGNKTPEEKVVPEEVKEEIELPDDVPFDLDTVSDDTDVSAADFDFSL